MSVGSLIFETGACEIVGSVSFSPSKMFLKLFVFALAVASTVKAQTYTAAVLEYAPQERQAVDTDEEYVLRNVRRYVEFIQVAVTRAVNIIVFPEYGLTTTILPADLTNFSTIVPEASLRLAPCDNRTNYANFFVDLSCAARVHSLFVVVNLIEREAVNETNTTLFYNTNVVFDISGTVVARYRKINLFNEPQLTPGNQTVTFTAFEVTFGLFTCFDILFRRPGQEVLEQGATDIIFPTAWTSETPFHHSFSIQDGYAKSAGVNLLAAGYSNISNGMAGAAIFSANATVVTSSFTPAAIQTMNIGVLSRLTNRTPNTVCDNNVGATPRIGLLPEISAVLLVLHEDMELYTFQDLPQNLNATAGKICSEGSDFCCNYHIEFNTQLNNASTIYRMAAFYGTRGFQDTATPVGTIGTATCALLHCSGENTKTCGLFNTTSNVNFRRIIITASLNSNQNTFYQPATLDTNHAPITNYAYCTNQEGNVLNVTMNIENVQNVFAFGIFGRVYQRDGTPEGRGAATTINVSFVAILSAYVCLVMAYRR